MLAMEDQAGARAAWAVRWAEMVEVARWAAEKVEVARWAVMQTTEQRAAETLVAVAKTEEPTASVATTTAMDGILSRLFLLVWTREIEEHTDT